MLDDNDDSEKMTPENLLTYKKGKEIGCYFPNEANEITCIPSGL